MCFPKPPEVKMPTMPTKQEVVSQEDSIGTQIQAEKKRRGFQSTIATSGMGITDPAAIKKTQLGG